MNMTQMAVVTVVNELGKKDPLWWKKLSETLEDIYTGKFERGYLDTIFQNRHPIDIYETFCSLQIHVGIELGAILMAIVNVESTPYPDKAEEENNNVLSNLWHPFSANFHSGLYLNDGQFSWSESLSFGQENSEGVLFGKEIKPGSAPLEVGYTKASTTLMHLASERYLARWPYGSKYIYLFAAVNDKLFRRSHAPNGGSTDPYEGWLPPVIESSND